MKHNAIQSNLDLAGTYIISGRSKSKIKTTNAARKHLREQPVSDDMFAWALKNDPALKIKIALESKAA